MGDFGRLICLANAEHVLSVFDFYFAVLLALRALPSAINLKTTNDSGGLVVATFVILMNANLREKPSTNSKNRGSAKRTRKLSPPATCRGILSIG